jgi:hypothetical protein
MGVLLWGKSLRKQPKPSAVFVGQKPDLLLKKIKKCVRNKMKKKSAYRCFLGLWKEVFLGPESPKLNTSYRRFQAVEPSSKNVRRVIVIAVLLLITSCTQKTFTTKKELWNYLKEPDNGYTHHKNIHGIDYTFYYKPTDLLVDQELDSVSEAAVQKLRAKYEKYLYFTLALSKNGKELLATAPDRQKFGRMVHQLSFGMGAKVHLYTPQKDTLNLLDYSAPRTYGMSPTTTILFVYPNEEIYRNSEYLTFAIEDFGLQTGDVTFKIETTKIKNQPRLTFGL